MQDASMLQLFNDDIGISEQLLELIDSEHQALGERDLDSLQQILNAKQPLLSQLGQHAQNRAQLLQSLQLSADLEGLQALAASSPLGAELLKQSSRLTQLLERCQTGNLRNGRLIRSSQTSTRSMLSILNGNETPSLYDSSGSASRGVNQRPLSQA
ncbi:flagella synthesis protein FlgN [Pseudomonas segetis]|uniref:Flagella synthesis protein FlgN n=1 Tax=Pseudomonas segetis TaxID=298908 RepID=A0A239JVG9_9PSED|nr:flagellar protein FlgN [Pseudomonas segetis]SNT08874.1 flagella synthesis protein FlgN [Pseudomonas segetis]